MNYSAVWLSAYPSEKIADLSIAQAIKNKSKVLVIDMPIGMERIQAQIDLSHLNSKEK